MSVKYITYKAKKIINVHKHVDAWFWDKYSAHPYIGCQHGCEYCYWRDEKYNMLARDATAQDLNDPFSQCIKVKENAPELLEKELSKLPKDVIATGDYQPAETNFRLSRKMLEVCLKLGFPVLINEKSPLLLKDLDLIKAINEKTWACVIWSITYHASEGYLDKFEPSLSTIESRFTAMKKVADAGIMTGTAFMPILPFICDSDENLETVVKKTAENGGTFVLAASLTMSGAQATRYLQTLAKHYPNLVERHKQLYDEGYSPKREYSGRIGRKVKELCERYGILDRMPRHIQPGITSVNKRVAEKLFNETYYMEIKCENPYKIWAYRKAAWSVDEFKDSIESLYNNLGRNGLKIIPGVGETLSLEIEKEIQGLQQGAMKVRHSLGTIPN